MNSHLHTKYLRMADLFWISKNFIYIDNGIRQ
jgi:hypothetical protein